MLALPLFHDIEAVAKVALVWLDLLSDGLADRRGQDGLLVVSKTSCHPFSLSI